MFNLLTKSLDILDNSLDEILAEQEETKAKRIAKLKYKIAKDNKKTLDRLAKLKTQLSKGDNK